MSRRPNPLLASNLADAAAREAAAVRQFECSSLLFLAAQLRLQGAVREAAATVRERTDRDEVTFDAFLEAVPALPFYLGFQRLGALHNAPTALLPALFNQFGKSPIAKAYKKFFADNEGRAEGRHVGLVFPRNRVVRGLILHNGPAQAYCAAGTSMLVNDDKLGVLVLQKFATFAGVLYANRNEWL